MLATLIVFAIVGLVLYLVETYIPMPAPMKLVLRVIVVLVLVVYLLDMIGIDTGLNLRL